MILIDIQISMNPIISKVANYKKKSQCEVCVFFLEFFYYKNVMLQCH